MKTLKAQKRDTKENLEKMRDEGNIPAVLYGRKTDSTPISVPLVNFLKLWHEVGESGMFVLKENGEEHNALIHDVALHPVSEVPLHIDFYVVEKGQKVSVNIPLEFVGGSPAVENFGAVLVKVLYEVELEAEPHKLPQSIKVDVSSLEEFGDHITVADIALPEDVEIHEEKEETVALVQEPREDEEEAGEEAGEIDLESIEVEGEVSEGEVSEEEGGEPEVRDAQESSVQSGAQDG